MLNERIANLEAEIARFEADLLAATTPAESNKIRELITTRCQLLAFFVGQQQLQQQQQQQQQQQSLAPAASVCKH